MTAINEKLNKGSENKAARRFFLSLGGLRDVWMPWWFSMSRLPIFFILTMLSGQKSERFRLAGSIDWFSFLTSLMNNPLDSGAIKYRLQEFTVLPGLNSIVALESIPSSGRNLSCSWLLHKISLFVIVGGIDGSSGCSCSIDDIESESLSAKKINKEEKIKLRSFFQCNRIKFVKSEKIFSVIGSTNGRDHHSLSQFTHCQFCFSRWHFNRKNSQNHSIESVLIW